MKYLISDILEDFWLFVAFIILVVLFIVLLCMLISII